MVLILSIAPCCGLTNTVEQDGAKLIVDHENADVEENCADECSPFYACIACGGVMLTPLISFNTPPPTLIPRSFNHKYLPSSMDGIDQNIWQPPKLS